MAFMGDEEDDLDLGPPPPALDRLPPPPPRLGDPYRSMVAAKQGGMGEAGPGSFSEGMRDLALAKGAPGGDAPPIAPGEGGPMRRRRRRFGSNRMPQMLGQATVAPGTPDVTPYMERLKSLFGTYGGL